MLSVLPGIGGTLLPGRYLADRLAADNDIAAVDEARERRRRQLVRWWAGVAAQVGPATGLRALFDLVAMPLAGMLGFRAKDASFDRGRARGALVTPRGTRLAFVLLPWASSPSALWRDVIVAAREIGARWAFLVAPPFLSVVDAGGHATRRSLDVHLPAAFDPRAFPAFWTLVRADAFDPPARLDRVVSAANVYQDRVRGDLRHGVNIALDHLVAVVDRGADEARLDEALTIVYRILFLLFAESRDLVPRGHPIYARAYSTSALAAAGVAGGDAGGTWDALAAITRLARMGCRTDELIVRPFNGRLFARRAAPSLERRVRHARGGPAAGRRDRAMQQALVALGSRPGPNGREPIAYADLGVDELGAVYERVLDRTGEQGTGSKNGVGWNFRVIDNENSTRPHFSARPVVRRHSRRRRETGTFYTPQPLAEFVVRRTLEPLVAGRSSDAILALRIVDPAMGSGAFLVAACRFLAAACERAMAEEGRLSAAGLGDDGRAHIRRLVAERCLAGVDRNPVAVQLARLSLWLATLADGRPLTFLDHRLRVGNSLVGASPDDLSRAPVRRARSEPTALPLFDHDDFADAVRLVSRPLADLLHRPDDTVADVRAKESIWNALVSDHSPLRPWRIAADAWCAQWFPAEGADRPSAAELRAVLDSVLRSDRTLPPAHLARRLRDNERARRDGAFFHWPLEFSDVFYDDTGSQLARAGFDAVIGNPPWEMLRRDHAENERGHDHTALLRFVRESGIYAACGSGHLNLYQPFVERALALARPGGRVGLILPWGLAADDGAAALRRRLLETGALRTIVGLDNAAGMFPIHRGLRFLVVVASPGEPAGRIRARFGVKTTAELDELPGRDDPERTAFPVELDARRLRRVGGPMLRVPDVRRAGDLAIAERLADTFPAFGSAEGWGARFGRELNATDDRASFGASGLAVVDGKHLEPFRVDLAKVDRRITHDEARRRLPDGRFTRPRLGYRDVSGVANARSLIAAVLPAAVVSTHTIFCLRTPVSLDRSHFLAALFNSFVLNMVVRLLMGSHVTTTLVEGLPGPVYREGPREQEIVRLARGLADNGWSVETAARLQAEVARLYGVTAAELRGVLDGFPLVPEAEKTRALQVLSAGC